MEGVRKVCNSTFLLLKKELTIRRTIFCVLLIYVVYYLRQVKKIKLIYNQNDDETKRLISQSELLTKKKYYWPLFIGPSKHLQILWLMLLSSIRQKIKFVKDEVLQLEDGGTLLLQYANPIIKQIQRKEEEDTTEVPIILLFHSLLGRGEDYTDIINEATYKGYRCIVMNRRGHGNSNRLKTPNFNTLGNTEDAIKVLMHINKAYPAAKIIIVGLSAGSALAVRLLGELGERARNEFNIAGAVGISPGYQIHPHVDNSLWNRMHKFYERYCLESMKKFFLHDYDHLYDVDDELRQLKSRLLSSPSISDFQSHIYKFAGYSSNDEYVRNSCPVLVSQSIRVPVMMINSTDDPICPQECILLDLFNNPLSLLVLTQRGSHFCFFNFSGFSSFSTQLLMEWSYLCLSR